MSSIREKLSDLWQILWVPQEDVTMKYPVEADSRRIVLPSSVRSKLREDIDKGYKQDAVILVEKMTGATQDEAADYIDKMERSMQRRRYR